VESGDHSTYENTFGNRKMMLLKFDGTGDITPLAQVSVPVDGDFGSGLFAVYEITDDGPVLRSYGRVSNGMATFSIHDFSDHLIVKLDADPAASNIGTEEEGGDNGGDNGGSEDTGGSSGNTLLYVGVGGAVAAIAIAGVVLFMRRP
jgi:hypothetical protein